MSGTCPGPQLHIHSWGSGSKAPLSPLPITYGLHRSLCKARLWLGAVVSGRIFTDPGLWHSQRASAPATVAIRFPDRSSSSSSLDGGHSRADSKIHGHLASPCPPPDELKPDDRAWDRPEEGQLEDGWQAKLRKTMSGPCSAFGLIVTTWAKSELQSGTGIRREFPSGDWWG